MFRRGFGHGRRFWRDEDQRGERHEGRGEERGERREGRSEERGERQEGRGQRGEFPPREGGRFGRGPHAFWFAPGGRGGFERGRGDGGPFGGGPFGGGPFGGRRRQRRGDIKYVLLELIAEQPRHGYDLIKELESRYAGFYRPSPGSVYPTLQLLEDEGSLESATEGGKRIYTITEVGKKLLAERNSEGEGERGERHGPHGRNASPELNVLRERAAALAASVMQVARHGSPEQVKAVQALLDATTREVYGVLAGGKQPSGEQS